MDTLEAMERCYRQTESVVGALGPQHADLPTPCPLFDVRALFVHVIGVLDMFTAALHDEPYSERGGELFDGDPLATYRATVDTNLAAWRARENLDGTLTLPFGTIPAAMGARLSTVDVLVHGWDFASATGQATSLPEDLAADSLGFVQQMLRPEMRKDAADASFGLEVEVPPDAPTSDRLVAFLGRRPA
jgi:uncharacterized protein (TIGR03086 family)